MPASELLLYPEATLASAKNPSAVLISRSGRTSEVVRAAALLKSRRVPTLAITCAAAQPLQDVADQTIVLHQADERSTVMTRSFSSMLLSLQALVSEGNSDARFFDQLHKMPEQARPLVSELAQSIRNFANRHDFADYVALGQGPFFGVACECALKLTEMSISYAQSFHTLEFRHGPKSIVGPETLLLFLLSDSGYETEREVLEEMKDLGATTLVIVNKADARVRAASDLLVELALDVPELARLAPSVVAGQLLGLYSGLRKGLNPDSPRNLTRVVMLDEQPSKPV
jgi:glucosamine--fructose-6-phosphate aminotransferase (isomerizing)